MSLAGVKAAYDRRFGRPSEAVKVALQEECKKIKAVSTWPEFFKRLDFPVIPSPGKVCDMLRRAVENSNKKGYHKNGDYTQVLMQAKKKIREEQAAAAKMVAPPQQPLPQAVSENDHDEEGDDEAYYPGAPAAALHHNEKSYKAPQVVPFDFFSNHWPSLEAPSSSSSSSSGKGT